MATTGNKNINAKLITFSTQLLTPIQAQGWPMALKAGEEPVSLTKRRFRSKNIEPIPIWKMQVVPFNEKLVKAKKRCHWCGTRGCEDLVSCLSCGREFFCVDIDKRGINIEANNENAGGEDKEKEDDDNSGEGAEDEVDEGVDAEEDIDGNEAVFSNAGIYINIEANNEIEEEGEESGRDEDSETMIRKRKSLGLGSMMKRMRYH
ncbi:hypothetical protein Bca4012_041048 [Brassica carinata]|uniref:Uncharacterized protein n=1 Tax=Brassica carinata TaxID=52824 RepID=A0A8X7UH81_BRACI|nr:hypothetical protein Bca52824_061197 [Brassica carinata]